MSPKIDPASAGKAAVVAYDRNQNGLIDAAELESAVSLKAALSKLDLNKDSALSAEEIAHRVDVWQRSKVAALPLSCSVLLDGKPVVGARITLVPENFQGAAVKACSGETDPQGHAVLSIDDVDLKGRRIRGVHCGFFRVQIVAPDVPKRYAGEDTPLGVEIAHDDDSLRAGIVFRTTKRGTSPTH